MRLVSILVVLALTLFPKELIAQDGSTASDTPAIHSGSPESIRGGVVDACH
jgi:hypothetical protein